MPTSRKDKSRKQKQLKYKKSKKMSNLPEMKPFRQVPTWNADDNFTVKGNQFEALYNFFNIFAPAMTAVQQIFAEGLNKETIKVKYEYEDGTAVPDEEIKEYTKKLNDYFKKQTGSDIPDQEQIDLTPSQERKSTLLSSTGEPITDKESV